MADVFRVIRKATRALVYGFSLTTAIPLLLGYFLNVPADSILALIGSTLILQANGVFIGLGIGLDPLFVLVVMIFVELGAVLAIYEILGAFEESERVKRFVAKADAAIKKYVNADQKPPNRAAARNVVAGMRSRCRRRPWRGTGHRTVPEIRGHTDEPGIGDRGMRDHEEHQFHGAPMGLQPAGFGAPPSACSGIERERILCTRRRGGRTRCRRAPKTVERSASA